MDDAEHEDIRLIFEAAALGNPLAIRCRNALIEFTNKLDGTLKVILTSESPKRKRAVIIEGTDTNG